MGCNDDGNNGNDDNDDDDNDNDDDDNDDNDDDDDDDNDDDNDDEVFDEMEINKIPSGVLNDTKQTLKHQRDSEKLKRNTEKWKLL